MSEKIQYWFYLQPYTFIFNGKTGPVVYNSISGYYLKIVDEVSKELLHKLQQPENGYCIPITNAEANNEVVASLIDEIRNSFSGDIIPLSEEDICRKPFIVPPILRLYNSVDTIKKEGGQALGEVILRNLNEVTFFLPGHCNKNCRSCHKYNKQFIHCSNFEEQNLHYEDYLKLFNNLDACGVNKVNLVINDFRNPVFKLMWNNRHINSFKKKYILNALNLTDEVVSMFSPDDELSIYVNDSFSIEALNSLKDLTYNLNIRWIHIVEDEYDMEKIDFTGNTSIIPFYNDNNLSFFENNIYLTMDDLLESPIRKQTIFRRQALNENFFGKIFILPSGDAYSNLNKAPLGNLKEIPLGQIVYNEFDDSKAWLLTRDAAEESCAACANRYLCPSISNYELAIRKTNLCHMMP